MPEKIEIKKEDWRIIFLGTPAFASAHLRALLAAGYQVVAVITNRDKASGRGMRMQSSEVKKTALAYGIPVLTPRNLKDPIFLSELRSYRADLQVVVAFRMLPEVLWKMPPWGTINMHASYLPHYRGAAPIPWVIMNGEPYTGVSTFQLRHAIDTGDLLLRKKIPLSPKITAGELHDILMEEGSIVLIETLDALRTHTLVRVDQNQLIKNRPLKEAPKLHAEDGALNWQCSVIDVERKIRALSPLPGAFTHIDGQLLKIFKATAQLENPSHAPGTHQTDGKTYFHVWAKDGYLALEELQLAGKKKLSLRDFLHGWKNKTPISGEREGSEKGS